MGELYDTFCDPVKRNRNTQRVVTFAAPCATSPRMEDQRNPIAVEIGRRLRAARMRAGLKQQDVVNAVPGLERSRLSNYETGLRIVAIDIVKQLARVYGISAGYLLTLEDEPDSADISQLKSLYRQADARGKQAILQTAQFQASASVPGDPPALSYGHDIQSVAPAILDAPLQDLIDSLPCPRKP